MVTGVSTGFTRTMELVGTGYRASVAGKELTLNVGYSKPRVLPIPEGLKVTVGSSSSTAARGLSHRGKCSGKECINL
jgi:large subunit ribosomal protein L6